MRDIDFDNLAFEDKVGLKGLFIPSVYAFWIDLCFLKANWSQEEHLLVIRLHISYINH